MSLADLVNVSVSATTKTPSRDGFGTPLLLVQQLPAGWGANLVRTFKALKELTDAGFLVTDPAYKMASAVLGQPTAPTSIKIAKRSHLATKSIKFTVPAATAGRIYAFVVDGKAITYTVPSVGGPTTSTVATAIAALITGTANSVTATASGPDFTCTAAAGVVFDASGFYETGLAVHDLTSDPGIATDLAAVLAEDHDWYGLCIDSAGKAENLAAAAWVEANKKIAALDSCDSDCADPVSTTDAAASMQTAQYTRSHLTVATSSLLHYTSPALLGNRLPATPGSDTWKFKTLAGVAASKWKEGEKSAIFAKNANTYTTISKVNLTENGMSSAGEWMDQVRFIDWLTAEVQVRVFAKLANSEKVPYTNAGRDSILSVVDGALSDGVKAGGLAKNPPPTSQGPDVEDIDPVTKGSRLFPNMTFSGTLAGAIHALTINGTLSV